MIKIKILKDTPFDRAGSSISIQEFRLKYNYICSKDTSDEELVNYFHGMADGPGGKMAEFFKLDEVGVSTPLEFIYNGLLYTKQVSGLYHIYIPGAQLDCSHASVGSMPATQASEIFIVQSKFRKLVWYCVDNVHRKL